MVWRTAGKVGWGGGPLILFFPLRSDEATMLKEGICDHRHERMTVKAIHHDQSITETWPVLKVAKKPNRKSGCVNRPADALNIRHPTTDEPATLAPGPHGRDGFDRDGHGVCRIMVAVTMHMSSRRRPISLIRRSIINWTSASVMGFSVLAIKRRMELFSGRYFLDGRSRARGRPV